MTEHIPDEEPVKYFNSIEPLVMGQGLTYAEVQVGKRLVMVGDADFTVQQAERLRDWLNTVLP